MIYSDHWENHKLDGGNNLKLNNWIFDDISLLNLHTILGVLNTNGIDFKKRTTDLNILVRLNSGVELTFENTTETTAVNPNDFHLSSFSLMVENAIYWE
ncbi:hypothetical protein MHTCC0001_31860 [Flavobacteriaceae bacterium MHTCC 0001]